MRDRLTRRAGEEDGVVLIVVALLMTVIIACCALAIDLGSFYTAQRHAQSAADAAALAGAQDYASGTTSSTALGPDITTFVRQNYPDASSIQWTSSFGGTAGRIHVDVGGASPAFFGKALGVSSANIAASATAGATGTYGASAVFAMDTNCAGAGVTIDGNTFAAGNVHSNGSLSIPGNNSSLTQGTYGGPSNCLYSNTGQNTSITGLAFDGNAEPWPYDYSKDPIPAPPACSTNPLYTQPFFNWTTTMPQNQVYCATQGDLTINGTGIDTSGDTFIALQGKIVINGAQLTGNSSFYANGDNGSITFGANNSTVNGVMEATGANGLISITGNNLTGSTTMYGNSFSLTNNSETLSPLPGKNGLLLYDTGNSTLTIDGNGFLNGGTIFAPNAPIVFNGDGAGTVSGFIEGQDVTIGSSNHLTINGTGPSTNFGGTPGLVQ